LAHSRLNKSVLPEGFQQFRRKNGSGYAGFPHAFFHAMLLYCALRKPVTTGISINPAKEPLNPAFDSHSHILLTASFISV
jgi:hypothetical protein